MERLGGGLDVARSAEPFRTPSCGNKMPQIYLIRQDARAVKGYDSKSYGFVRVSSNLTLVVFFLPFFFSLVNPAPLSSFSFGR